MDRLLRGFLADYPSTPILLLSQFSSGIDQLLIERVLEPALRADVETGRLAVRAMLPKPIPEYAAPTEAGPGVVELLERTGNATASPPAWSGFDHEDPGDAEAREVRPYRRANAHIVRHAHVLLAFWDGLPLGAGAAVRSGGTAEVVAWSLRGLPREYLGTASPVTRPDASPVVHVVTPASNHPPNPAVPALRCYLLRPSRPERSETGELELSSPYGPARVALDLGRPLARGTIAEFLDMPALLEIDQFNAMAYDPRTISRHDRAASDLLSERDMATLPDALREVLGSLQDVHRRATYLAGVHKRDFLRTVRIIHLGGMLAVVGFELHHAHGAWAAAYPVALLSYAGMLLVTWAAAARSSRRMERLFFDLRTLAETLRVQFYWLLCGVPRIVADHMGRVRRNPLDWVGLVSRSLTLPPRDGSSWDHPPIERWRHVYYRWVRRQLRFFAREHRRGKSQGDRYHRASLALLASSIASALLLSAVEILKAQSFHEYLSRGLLAAAALGGAGWAAVASWRRRQRHELHWSWIALGIMFLLVATAHFVPRHAMLGTHGDAEGLMEYGLATVATLLAGAGIVHSYGEKQAFTAHARRYLSARAPFFLARAAWKQAVADRVLTSAEQSDLTRLYEELGEYALAENDEWLLTHLERPLEPSIP